MHRAPVLLGNYVKKAFYPSSLPLLTIETEVMLLLSASRTFTNNST